jgi:hypothetical protein
MDDGWCVLIVTLTGFLLGDVAFSKQVQRSHVQPFAFVSSRRGCTALCSFSPFNLDKLLLITDVLCQQRGCMLTGIRMLPPVQALVGVRGVPRFCC